MRVAWSIGILASLLASCATSPINPLYSAWYIQYDAEVKNPKMYVTLLNRGEDEIVLKNVILNRTEEANADKIAGHTRDPHGWKLFPSTGASAPDVAKHVLAPGKLVVLQAKKFVHETKGSFDKDCLIPVEVAVELDGDQLWLAQWISRLSGDPPLMIRADLIGRLPSELPTDWGKNCSHFEVPAPTATAKPATTKP